MPFPKPKLKISHFIFFVVVALLAISIILLYFGFLIKMAFE